MLLPAFASAYGAGYMPLLVLPWAFGELISRGYTESQAGTVASAEIAALAMTSFICARRATLAGRRRIAIAGVLISAVANGIAAMIAPFGLAFWITRILSGCGLGAAVAVGNATAAGARHPTRGFAALLFLLALWQLLIFNAAPWAVTHAGLGGNYVLLAFASAIWLPWIARLPDPSSTISAAQPTSARRQGLNAPVRLEVVVSMLVLFGFFCFWLRDSLSFAMSERLATAHGLSGESLGRILGVASLGALVGPALAARVGHRERSFGLLACGLLAVLMTSGAMGLARSPTIFGVATLLMPATSMFAAALLSGLAAVIDPTGRLPALGAGVGFASEAFGPALGGGLIQIGGQRALAVGIVAAGLLTLAAGLMAIKLGRNDAAHPR